MIPILAAVEQEIVHCFRVGGGVPYTSYMRIQDLIADETRARHDESLIGKVLPLVPSLAERLTDGIEVADVGCGSGHAINLLASAFPRSRFIGYDISSEDIQAGWREAERMGLSNVRFVAKDAEALKMSEKFDLITAFDSIHIQAQPRTVLRRIATALRSDGTLLMVDFAASSRVEENLNHPLGPFMYTFSCMHCMTVSLAQDGEGLGAVWGEEKARQMLNEAGFIHIEVKQIASDIFHNYFIASLRQPQK
jgi:ubiquinone/menaquinone biosynthesis C-methylase UbiE